MAAYHWRFIVFPPRPVGPTGRGDNAGVGSSFQTDGVSWMSTCADIVGARVHDHLITIARDMLKSIHLPCIYESLHDHCKNRQ